ncbi:MAG: ribosomal-processing cysteine protease Prp [Lachnospiraceae bacterium]
MTTVIIEKSSDTYKSITCMGHAGRKRLFFEKDLVCASISVLVLNTLNGLDEFTDTDMEVTSNEETGFIRCVFMGTLSDEAIVLVKTMIHGLEQISLQYGRKYCNVEFKEV